MTAEPALPLDEVVARKVQAKRKVRFMTAAFYLGEMLVGSLLAIALLVTSHLRMSADAALFAAGIVAWTLAEYLVHRFVLHDLIPTQHGLHHAHPDAPPILTIFWRDLTRQRPGARCRAGSIWTPPAAPSWTSDAWSRTIAGICSCTRMCAHRPARKALPPCGSRDAHQRARQTSSTCDTKLRLFQHHPLGSAVLRKRLRVRRNDPSLRETTKVAASDTAGSNSPDRRGWLAKRAESAPSAYSAASTALAISAVPFDPPNSIGLMPSA